MQQIAAVLNNIMNIYVSSIKSSWEKVCLDCFVKKKLARKHREQSD